MSGTSKLLMKIKEDKLKNTYKKAGNPDDEKVLLLETRDELDPIYEALDIPSEKEYIKETLKDINSIKHYEKVYNNKEAFKGYFIKELCHKYFLTLQKLNKLESYLPTEAVEAISKFSKEFDKEYIQSSFYILTGFEHFKEKNRHMKVKTFILFYVDPSDMRSTRYINENSTLIQFYSSGNDWKTSRSLLKHIDTNTSKSDISMLSSNIIGLVFPFIISITYLLFKQMILSIIFASIMIIFFIINEYFNNHNYKKNWTQYED